jgi:hypothetical protein
VVQLTRTGVRRGSAAAIAAARDEFDARHVTLLPRFLDAEMLGLLTALADAAVFERRVHVAVTPPSVDVAVCDPRVQGIAAFVLNDPGLLTTVRELTGCADLRYFNAVIRKDVPGEGHISHWHDDADGNRLVAMTVNLGRDPFEGGVLTVRRRGEATPLRRIEQFAQGDAVLFRIDESLEHSVSEVTGRVARLALTGWFQRDPDYAALVTGEGAAPLT